MVTRNKMKSGLSREIILVKSRLLELFGKDEMIFITRCWKILKLTSFEER